MVAKDFEIYDDNMAKQNIGPRTRRLPRTDKRRLELDAMYWRPSGNQVGYLHP